MLAGRMWIVVALTAASVVACMPRETESPASSAATGVTDDGGASSDVSATDEEDALAAPDGGGEAGLDDAPDAPTPDSGGEAGIDATGSVDDDAMVDGSTGTLDSGGAVDSGGEAGVDSGGEAGVDSGVTPDASSSSDAAVDAGTTIDAPPVVLVVDVIPSVVDFGEHRVGATAPSAVITVTNQSISNTSAQITSYGLRNATPTLSLAAPSVPLTLAPGQSVQATLTLATSTELDLAGEHVDITVSGTVRSVPVLGKVVTPSSYIEPANLDLGTACVGAQVSGTATLVNDGTATLRVDAPSVDATFTVASTGTPGDLAPMQSLVATIAPATTEAGARSGTLRWHDDVPTDHEVDLAVEFIASGTAVSPKGLDFGTMPVGASRITRDVRLENCDVTPSTIEVASLRSTHGPLSAWQVNPPIGTRRSLSSREVEVITVTFDPSGRGPHEAELTVMTADGPRTIPLLAEATGRDFTSGSFYMCMCSGGGPIQNAWPIPAAVLLVFCRRRRRSAAAG